MTGEVPVVKLIGRIFVQGVCTGKIAVQSMGGRNHIVQCVELIETDKITSGT